MGRETEGRGFTTEAVDAFPREGAALDPTPGLVLVYSRLHESLPAVVPISARGARVGRESDNTLAIPESAVSRYHAEVFLRGGQVFVKDLGSTNGTMVNGEKVTEVALEPFDLVRIGDTLFRFAHEGVFRFAPYRVNGDVVATARMFSHDARSALAGGFQVDALLNNIDKVAKTGLSVIVLGESGTGKELVSNELHLRSGRTGAMQAINCAALPAQLIESELFGHKRGAFTGATSDKLGLVRAADHGTLFLDEIGDMPLAAQAKLLRVLQQREVVPVGETKATKVDVRVICATHRNLEHEVAEGRFRGDLLARLQEMTIQLPPLRERKEDLYLLVRRFLSQAGHPDRHVSFSFMLAAAHHHWPYNVRELQSAVKLAVALSEGAPLEIAHLPPGVQVSIKPTPAKSAPRVRSRRAEAPGTPTEEELRDLLQQMRGNVAAVGRAVGKERMQVHRWMKRYGIDPNDYR